MVTRRQMLKLSAGAVAGTAAGVHLTGPAFSAALGLAPGSFQYGVACGDPLPNQLVIWTRVTPDPAATPGSGLGDPTNVQWRVATDAALSNVVQSGNVVTAAASDHTVKVDVGGLDPATTYYYGFTALGEDSPVGSGRTAPAANTTPERLRFGFVSCSNYPVGYFAPYRYLAQRCDLDFVLHVGDYIYEYGSASEPNLIPGREPDPTTEMISLEDYRRRHALYKADADLQALHAACAWIVTIDDHEVTNDTWREGAQNHQPATEGDYLTRRNASYQAYLEWMPIRTPVPAPTSGETRLYRRFTFGTLADLLMLDLRQYRDQQVAWTDPATSSPTRTMLGEGQRTWLLGQLDDPQPPKWRLVGNSVQIMQVDWPFGVFSNTTFVSPNSVPPVIPANLPTSRNIDAWDGYPAERQTVLAKAAQHAGDYDMVFLTGDIHSSWASELPQFAGPPVQAGYTSVATEFVCTSVTSDNFDELAGAALSAGLQAYITAMNPHIKKLEGDSHGASVVEVTADGVQCDWYYTHSTDVLITDDRRDPLATLQLGNTQRTAFGSKTVQQSPAPIIDDCVPDPVVPEVSLPVLLPIAGAAALVGGAIALRRRGSTEVSAV